MNQYYIYIMSSKTGTLYTGMTNELQRRVYQHKNTVVDSFTSKYDINRLVYFETFGDVLQAIAREKQIKGWTRRKKLALIESQNPTWRDLSDDWMKPNDK